MKPLRLGLLATALLLAGCAQTQFAAWQTTRHYLGLGDAIDQRPLNPAYRYLRVITNGSVALLVLGYVDHDAAGRPVEVWYSAGQETLRLQDGRLVGVAGVPLEWRNVVLGANLPAWRSVTAARTFSRQRDEMPGYRIGLQEQVTVRPIEPPSRSALAGADTTGLRWYEDTTAPSPDLAPELAAYVRRLPPARYAVWDGTAVYGEQCIAPDLCLSWQSWPPQRKEP